MQLINISQLMSFNALGGDKARMLTYTYPHKHLGKIKVVICNHQVDSLFFLWLISTLVICKLLSMVVRDTECPCWNQVSLHNTNSNSCLSTYPYKPLRKIKGPYAITRLTVRYTRGLMSLLMICKQKEMVIHDTECPKLRLGVIKHETHSLTSIHKVNIYIY